jgi:hypothetical protein
VALRVDDLSINLESGDGVALIRNTKAGREESRSYPPRPSHG